MFNKEALIELAKSFGRFMYFGILGLLATFLTNLVTSGALDHVTVVVLGQNISLSAALVLGIGLLVKAIDRYRHTNPETPSNGIAPTFLQR